MEEVQRDRGRKILCKLSPLSAKRRKKGMERVLSFNVLCRFHKRTTLFFVFPLTVLAPTEKTFSS